MTVRGKLPPPLTSATGIVLGQPWRQRFRCPITRTPRDCQSSAAASDNSSLGCPIMGIIGPANLARPLADRPHHLKFRVFCRTGFSLRLTAALERLWRRLGPG